MIKLAAFDVDGTLRDRDFLPDSTRQALKKLKEKGISVTLCTGRSEYEVASLREELGIEWAITCNGSHIGFNGTTVYGNAFPADTIKEWLLEAAQSGHALLLYGSEKMLTNKPDSPYFRQAQQEIGFMEPVQITNPDDVPEIYQVIVFCSEQEQQRYLGTNPGQYYTHRWRSWAVDINPNGMNKAMGLKRLLDHLGLTPEDAAAFGDGSNDFEMLETAGVGIAMGNAVDELKKKANHVTKSLAEDGIHYAVEKWICV
jgi:Cof subfamily protein (haloacid dehalogenase superfamily)